jgi:hypothetical protein
VSVYVSLSLEEELDAVFETEWWRIWHKSGMLLCRKPAVLNIFNLTLYFNIPFALHSLL